MTGFLEAVDQRCIVVIDEAYCEYVDNPDYPDAMQLMETFPNVVTFRTFSKMYALAALRIGYLCSSPDVVDMVRRTHIVYSVNTPAQQAAAAAITDDRDFILATRKMVKEARQLLCSFFDNLGIPYLSNQGNYMMVHVPLSDTLIYRMLMKRGVMVRTMTGFRFPNWIRISLVQAPVMQDFINAFREVLSTLQK
jgi:histidinol-phosphate aminotransferase